MYITTIRTNEFDILGSDIDLCILTLYNVLHYLISHSFFPEY